MNSSNAPQTQYRPTDDLHSGESNGNVASAKQRLTETAREAAEKVKSAAASTLGQAKEEASKVVEEKKRMAADRIGGYSSAIHDSAKSLEENDPNIAWFTHRAAERIQGVADYVRDTDMAGLRTDIEGMARRHPLAFFGGLFIGGLVIANLVKASAGGASNNESAQAPAGDNPFDGGASASGSFEQDSGGSYASSASTSPLTTENTATV